MNLTDQPTFFRLFFYSMTADFVQSSVVVKMHLAPSFAGNVMQGVHEKLNRLLMRYNDDVRGVIVSYSNLRLARTGRILYDCPFVHFSVSAAVTAFAPAVGAPLGTHTFTRR